MPDLKISQLPLMVNTDISPDDLLAIVDMSSGITKKVTVGALELTGPQGPQGPTGATGPQGPTGVTGNPGAQGPQGVQGASGNTILYGAGAPNNASGNNGDTYINTSNNTIYGPKAAGVWPAGTSLVGPQGAAGTNGTNGTNGNTVLYGASNPAAGVGNNGDFYINTATNYIFGPKLSGAWPAGTSLVGPQGPQGTTGATGPTGPTGPVATVGIVPIGGIVATFPNLTGAYSTTATTVADAAGFVLCQGQTLADPSSPMNTVVIPNLNASQFVRGATTAGGTGGAASVALVAANLPAHSHDMSHTHGSSGVSASGSATTGTMNQNTSHTHGYVSGNSPNAGAASQETNQASTGRTTGSTNIDHTHNFSVSVSGTAAGQSFSGSTGNGPGTATAVPTVPPFISVVYIMRVK